VAWLRVLGDELAAKFIWIQAKLLDLATGRDWVLQIWQFPLQKRETEKLLRSARENFFNLDRNAAE
jgi:hypothetical protein